MKTMISGAAIRPPKNALGTKHLRVREDHELGGTRYRAICGSSGLRSMNYTKDLTKVNCSLCLIASHVTKKGK